ARSSSSSCADGSDLDDARAGAGAYRDRDAVAADALRRGEPGDERPAGRGRSEEPTGRIGGDQALVRPARNGHGDIRVHAYGPDAADGRPAGRDGAEGRRRPLPAARRRQAARVRSEAGDSGAGAHVRGDEDDGPRGRHSRAHRAARRADERDVDRAIGQLGVDAADHEPARTCELVLHLRPRHVAGNGDDDPRPRNRHAGVEAATLVRGSRAVGAGRERGCERRREDGDPLHGTLRNHKAESVPPPSINSAAPPAKKSVSSRETRLWPIRDLSWSYTWLSRWSFDAVKNWPPLVCAIC